MTSVFCCGGECGVAGVHWALTGAGTTFTTSGARSGARALRFNPSAAVSYADTIPLTSATRWVVRFYIWFDTLPSVDIAICSFSDGGPMVRFKQSDSKVYAAVATTFGATGVSVTTGVWYRIDADLNIQTAGNDVSDVQVDGVACGQATATGVSAGATTVRLGSNTTQTSDYKVDDFVVTNTAADYPIGAGNVYHFVPTSDGTHNVAGAADFKRGAAGVDITNSTTDSYLLVDDVPLIAIGTSIATLADDYINAIAPPNATDYTENKFGPAPGISTPTTGPRAVDVMVETCQASTATGSFKLNLNDNGTVNTIKEQVTIAGVITVLAWNKHYATAPSTGAAWTAALFNDLRVRFYSADAAPDQYFVAAMIEAEFAPVAGRTTKNTRAFPLGVDVGMGFGMGGGE